MKRQGDNGQLSREEYDALDEDEAEAGVYKKASADKMAGRKIVKRGQKFAHFGNQNTAPLNTTKPSSAFSSLSSNPAPAAPKTGNVFGSIALTSNATPAVSKPGNVFGNIALASRTNSAPLGINKTPSTATANTTTGKPSTATATASNNSAPQSKIQKLNKSFKCWVDTQMIHHSVSNWAAGLQDYVKHAHKIAETLTKEEDNKADNKTSSSFGSFPTTNSTLPDTKVNAPSATSIGVFGNNAASKSNDSKTSGFGGYSTVPTPAPLPTKQPDFGGFGTTTTAPKPAFSVSLPEKTTAPAVGGFTAGFKAAPATTSFGNIASSSGPGGTASSSQEYEGEPILEPEKIYKNENDTDEILYEANCKAFRFDTTEKEWKDSGKGSLRMTQEPGVDKKKILVRNTLGKITINAYIFKGMNIKQAGKTGLQFMAVVDASGVPQSFLVKVKATDIQTALDKFTKAEQEAK